MAAEFINKHWPLRMVVIVCCVECGVLIELHKITQFPVLCTQPCDASWWMFSMCGSTYPAVSPMGWNCLNCLKIGCQTSISVAEMLPKTKADWLPMHKMTDLWCRTKTKKLNFEKRASQTCMLFLSVVSMWSTIVITTFDQNTRILWLSKKRKQRQQRENGGIFNS